MQKSSRSSSFSDRGDFGAQSKSSLSLTQGFVYVFGSVSVIINSKWSWSTRRKVSCRVIWSLCGEPNGSVQVLSVKPFESFSGKIGGAMPGALLNANEPFTVLNFACPQGVIGGR